jgi:hypothetical protein
LSGKLATISASSFFLAARSAVSYLGIDEPFLSIQQCEKIRSYLGFGDKATIDQDQFTSLMESSLTVLLNPELLVRQPI